MLTPDIEELADKLLGTDFNTCMLRLIPYLHHTIINAGLLDVERMNSEEQEIVMLWQTMGYLTANKGRLTCSRAFWTAMSEILWESYANYED